MRTLLFDLRLALRALVKQPTYALVAILTLALGIGANTAIFTVADAALRRGLPFHDASALVSIAETSGHDDFSQLDSSYPNFMDWRAQSHAFAGMAAFAQDGYAVRSATGTDLLLAVDVSADFFGVLQATPARGRLLGPADATPEAPGVVVISDAFWQERFGGQDSAVGATLTLDDKPYTVVGVLPKSFAFGLTRDVGLYAPLVPSGPRLERRNLQWTIVFGRLAPGATLAAARTEMDGIASQLATMYPAANAGRGVHLEPLDERVLGKVRPIVLLLLAAVGLVLLVACANAANLTLARATARRKELAVRAALGATRGRLVWQLTVESVLLSAVGGGLGVILAMWGTDLLTAVIPKQQLMSMPYLAGLHVDGTALVFAFCIAIAAGVAVGALPALSASRLDVQAILMEEGRTSAGATKVRLRDLLVVAEVAIAFVLLVGAGLIGQSLLRVTNVYPGFNTSNLLTARLNFSANVGTDPQAIVAHDELQARLAALPGVIGVTTSSVVPLTGEGNTIGYVVEGRPDPGRAGYLEANIREVSPSYFAVLEVPLRAGRAFDSGDRPDGARVVIINETLARRVFGPDGVEAAIGQRLRFTFKEGLPPLQIVGVVGDERSAGLDAPGPPAIYQPFAQSTSTYMGWVVRTTGDPGKLSGAVRHAIEAYDPGTAVLDMETMDERIARSPWMFVHRFPAILVGAFSILALLLAVIGLYGVLAYSVGQRAHEIGIRRAMGAQRQHIVKLVVGRALALVATGIAIGVAIAAAGAGLVGSMLYGLGGQDIVTRVVVALVLAAVGVGASLLPLRRALRVDPMEVLR